MSYISNPNEEMIKAAFDSCGFKAVVSTVGGFGFGALFGMFMASMDVGMPYGGVPGMRPMPGQYVIAISQHAPCSTRLPVQRLAYAHIRANILCISLSPLSSISPLPPPSCHHPTQSVSAVSPTTML